MRSSISLFLATQNIEMLLLIGVEETGSCMTGCEKKNRKMQKKTQKQRKMGNQRHGMRERPSQDIHIRVVGEEGYIFVGEDVLLVVLGEEVCPSL